MCGKLSGVEVKKPAVYIETTVPNYFFSAQYPERRKAAKEVFKLIKNRAIRPFVSRAVVDELVATPNKVQKAKLLKLIEGIKVLPITEEVGELAQKYLDEGVFPKKKRVSNSGNCCPRGGDLQCPSSLR